MSDTPNFEKINELNTPSKLDLAVIFYGIDTDDNPEAQQDAEDAATELIDLRAKEAELAALQAERDALKAENEQMKAFEVEFTKILLYNNSSDALDYWQARNKAKKNALAGDA